MPVVVTPRSVQYRLARRQTDADLCADQALTLLSCNSAVQRCVVQAPGGARPQPRRPALQPPPWLRSFGGPFAVFCAAILGVGPFLGTAVVAFLADSPPQVVAPQAAPQPVVLQAPAALSAVGGEAAAGAAVLGALDGLRRDLQAQELARQASEVATGERVRRLEAALSAGGAAAGPVLQVAPEAANDGGDIASGLGVDWAAWSAGAEVDHAHTSTGLGRDPVGRAASMAALLFPRYRAYVGNVSHPPEVVLASESGPPSRCFAFGRNGSVAVRFPRPVRPRHVAIEQRPPWATLRPKAAPQRFEVRAWPAGSTSAERYTLELGAFNYALDGPRAQAFSLQLPASPEVSIQAVQFVFASNWGEDHTSVCRLRVLGSSPE